MTDADTLAQAEARIARLEEVVADYALRYGLSERARAVFGLGPTSMAGPSEVRPAALAAALLRPLDPAG